MFSWEFLTLRFLILFGWLVGYGLSAFWLMKTKTMFVSRPIVLWNNDLCITIACFCMVYLLAVCMVLWLAERERMMTIREGIQKALLLLLYSLVAGIAISMVQDVAGVSMEGVTWKQAIHWFSWYLAGIGFVRLASRLGIWWFSDLKEEKR